MAMIVMDVRTKNVIETVKMIRRKFSGREMTQKGGNQILEEIKRVGEKRKRPGAEPQRSVGHIFDAHLSMIP
jgi:phage gp16-like protein